MMYGTLCTEFYDADKKFADDAELDFYSSILSKDDLILEPMCGSGRLLIPLMKLGYNIEGFDRSTSMLSSCEKRALDLGFKPVLSNSSIEDFSTSKHYSAIVIPFGSFQLLYPRSSAYEALKKFYNLLKIYGRLIIDLFIPWDALYENGEVSEGLKRVDLTTGKYIEIKNKTTVNKVDQYMISRSQYNKYDEKNNLMNTEQEEMHITWYYKNEMILMLEKFGFKNIECTERFLNGSEHLTFVAHRTQKK